eukprot:2187117-Pyramimonas_sp.AAC.2
MRDNITVWWPISGDKSRIPVSSLVQLNGVKHSGNDCVRDRIGQVWVNDLYAAIQRVDRSKSRLAPQEWRDHA